MSHPAAADAGASNRADDRSGDGRSKRVLVTGAAGFIGSHLSERMLADGWEVWGLDNLVPEYSRDQKRSNLRTALRRSGMHFVEGDLRDPILLNGLLQDHPPAVIVHLAASHCKAPSNQDPHVCFDVNVIGTLKLLEAMSANHVGCLVLASDLPREAKRDEIYDAAKRSAELLVRAYSETRSLSAHVLRLAPVYGPRERPDLPVHSMARLVTSDAAAEAIDLSALSETWPAAPYLFVDDAVGRIASSVEALATGRSEGATPGYEVLEVSGPRDVGVEEIVRGLRSVFDRAVPREGAVGDEAGVQVPDDVEPVATTPVEGSNVTLGMGLSRFAEWFEARGSESGAPRVTSAGVS